MESKWSEREREEWAVGAGFMCARRAGEGQR